MRAPYDEDAIADTVVKQVEGEAIRVRDVADIEQVMTPAGVILKTLLLPGNSRAIGQGELRG